MSEAEEMKEHLEQQQRVRMRPFSDGKATYSPRWFTSVDTLDHFSFTRRSLVTSAELLIAI